MDSDHIVIRKRILQPLRSTNTVLMVVCIALVLSSGIGIQAQMPFNWTSALSWNSDGTVLAVAGIFADQAGIQLFDDSGQAIQFLGSPSVPLSVSWSPDDTRLATYIANVSLIIIWDVDTGNVLTTFTEPGAKYDYTVHWNPDVESGLLATEQAGAIHIRNAQTGDIEKSIVPSKPIQEVNSFLWSQDGLQIYTTSDDHTVRAWDANTMAMLRETDLYAGAAMAVSPSGDQLAVSSWFDTVSILDADTFELEQVLQGVPPVSQLLGVKWHPDGSQVAASGYDEIVIWDLDTGSVVNTLPLPAPSTDVRPQAMDYSPDGNLTFVNEGNAFVLQPSADAGSDQSFADNDNNGSEVVTLDGSGSGDSDGTIVDYEWSEDGEIIATGVNPQVDLAVGVHTITLTVTDDDGATDTDEVIITVEAASVTCDTTVTAGDVTGLISAIDTAEGNGVADTICLEEGTYTLTAVDNSVYGNSALPVIDTEITVVGLDNGATLARDTGAPNFRFFYVGGGGNLTLDTLTLTNGNSGSANGGAIYSAGTLNIADSTFTDNTTTGAGGAVRDSGVVATITDSVFTGNSAGNGGAIATYNASTPITITGSTITNNTASYRGGAINITAGLTLIDSTVANNTATNNGGGVYASSGVVSIINSTLDANSSNRNGGGIYINGGDLTLDNSTLSSNTATKDGGGIRSSVPVMIQNGTLVTGNHALDDGGGIYNAWDSVTVTDSTISLNIADDLGGGLAAFGDLITLTNTTISSNQARLGGGMFNSGSDVTLSNCQVSGNTSTVHGGGIFHNYGSLAVTASTFDSNQAGDLGGGISSGGTLNVTDSIFSNNAAVANGGAIHNDNSSPANGVHNSCIAGNSAPTGSGVYTDTPDFDAANNWWGAADGPSGSGGGSGDGVDDWVLFTPFITTGCPH
jgi:predicted outer membrane repeat protein